MNKEEIAKRIDEGLKILKQEPSFIFYLEEIKAIEELKEKISKPVEVPEDKFDTFILYNIENAKIILNLISKLQKELDKKDKVINELLYEKAQSILYDSKEEEIQKYTEKLKQKYFKKVEEENEN